MHEVRGDFCQRDEHKGTFRQARVRDLQTA